MPPGNTCFGLSSLVSISGANKWQRNYRGAAVTTCGGYARKQCSYSCSTKSSFCRQMLMLTDVGLRGSLVYPSSLLAAKQAATLTFPSTEFVADSKHTKFVADSWSCDRAVEGPF